MMPILVGAAMGSVATILVALGWLFAYAMKKPKVDVTVSGLRVLASPGTGEVEFKIAHGPRLEVMLTLPTLSAEHIGRGMMRAAECARKDDDA